MAIEWIPITFAAVMATIDVFMLSIIKIVGTKAKYLKWMIVPTIVYAIQPWIFLSALKFETMTVMNFTWDLMSDILVTIVGIYYFGEKLGPVKTLGVCTALLSIGLLAYDDGTLELNAIPGPAA
jgi:multidrug transporter EmrE-like cation transporter